MHKTYPWPMPQAEACYQAKVWLMDKDERRLFCHAIGLDPEPDRREWYGDQFTVNGDMDWWALNIDGKGRMLLWCPDMLSDEMTNVAQVGRWIEWQFTDFEERFHAQDLRPALSDG